MGQILNEIESGTSSVCNLTDKKALEENFIQNCIPTEFSAYTVENYEHFLAQRRVLMAKKIERFYKSL